MNNIVVVSLQSLTRTSSAGGGKLTYALSANLHQSGELHKLIVSSKGKFTTVFPCAPVSFLSRYYLFILNGFMKSGFIKYHQKRYVEEWLFDFLLQFQIDKRCSLLVTINPYLPKTLRRCKRLGVRTCLISTTPEENEINKRLTEAKKIWSVDKAQTDAYTYTPRLAMYNTSLKFFDKIIAYTSVVKNSFLKEHDPKKVEPCLGLSWAMQIPKELNATSQTKIFKVVYLAHTVLLKGLQDLLQAWSTLNNPGAELHIAGAIDNTVEGIIQARFLSLQNVFYYGYITNTNNFLSQATVLVCPSILDAGPATVLEAAALAIPSILTDGCGAVDVFEHQVSAFVVPASNPNELALTLQYCYDNPQKTKLIGQQALMALKHHREDEFITRLTKAIKT
jgi:glycosyltransferase involved in cell wall biosynthesis